MYARMFPELPEFKADETFLHAIGRAGGLCDCGDVVDTPESEGDAAAASDLRSVRRPCE
jgi:hypothetical protein